MKQSKLQTFGARVARLIILSALAASTLPSAQAGGGERQRRRRNLPDVNVIRNLVYKKVNGRSLRLDIYQPKTITHPLPIVVWIHGGHWNAGSKEQRQPINLMARGYTVVSIDYRLFREAPFPAQIEDCKAAVRWLRANAATYQLDPDHIGAWGHSAGGHLAALLGTSAGVAALEGDGDNLSYSSRIQAVCAMSAPSDLVSFYDDVAQATEGHGRRARSFIEQFLGGSPARDKTQAIAASPVTYVSKDDPPFLVIHGENDLQIPVNQAKIFVQKLKEAGVDATLVVAEGRGHSVGVPTFTVEITSFFDKNLKNSAPK